MKILVFENDVHSFQLLRHMLEEMNSDYQVIGPIPSVERGREYLSMHHDTDIIIADIKLQDGLCFDALVYAPTDIPIVFISSSPDYALRAFDFYSLSYLKKPIADGVLAEAMRKAHLLVAARNTSQSTGMLASDTSLPNNYRERFIVKSFNGERVITLSNILYIMSDHKATYLVLLDGTSSPIDLSLEEVAKQLNPALFMRVSRKYIVPVEQVCGMEHLINGKGLLKLKNSDAPEITISRTRKVHVRKWLDK